MAAPSWIKRFTEDEDDNDLDPTPLSRYSTPRGSFSELSQGTGSTRYLNAPSNGDRQERRHSGGQSNYVFYNESQREIPKRYLSPANANRQRDHVTQMGQNRGRRNLNSRYHSYSPDERRVGGMDVRRGSGEPRREESWAYIDNPHHSDIEPPLHTSASYGDYEGTTSSTASSGVFNLPRIRDVHSGSTHTLDEKRNRRKNRETSSDETGTSGYSTNSVSELSDFSSPYRSDKGKTPTSGGKRRQSTDDRGSKSSNERISSRESKTLDRRLNKRSESNLSVDESVNSLSSSRERTRKAKEAGKRASSASIDSKLNETPQKTPTIGNVAVTVTNNIQYDPNDPFSFIQPVDLPFHKKVRKCMGPVIAVIVLLILAACLGAAIYFATALKETQENQIDLLKATLAMKIRDVGYIEDLDHISNTDFQFLSSKYCSQMDEFYSKSRFKDTYRGCEVISIKNHYINFTLFFFENEAKSSDIINVIESSAPKVQKDSTNVALVDKFELELDSVKVKIERQLESETFNKNSFTPPPPLVAETMKPIKTTDKPTQKIKEASPSQEPTTTTTKSSTVTRKKAPPEDGPIYSWNPCSKYEGTYFPHPVRCDKFFQCSNGQTIEHTCTSGLIYHWKEFTCVSKFMPNVDCPDPAKAPPRPSTTTEPPTTPTTPTSKSTKKTTRRTPTTTVAKPSTTKTINNVQHIERPEYPANPCLGSETGKLHPHPDDCKKFIQCVNGKVQQMSCADRLVFYPNVSQCMFPTKLEQMCPCAGKDDGYFPHPFDCSKYIRCQFKKEVVFTCKAGLVWNKDVNSCVYRTAGTTCPSDLPSQT